jgi:hypothetical protein
MWILRAENFRTVYGAPRVNMLRQEIWHVFLESTVKSSPERVNNDSNLLLRAKVNKLH